MDSREQAVEGQISAALACRDLRLCGRGRHAMSAVEEFVHAFIVVMMLAASLAFLDPQHGLAGVLKRAPPAAAYMLQSCSDR